VSIPFGSPLVYAEQLYIHLGIPHPDNVSIIDPATGLPTIYAGFQTGTNFLITPGQGYIVVVPSSRTYTPPTSIP